MRKILNSRNIILVVCLLVLLIVAACGNDNTVVEPTQAPTQAPTLVPDPTEVPTPRPSKAPLDEANYDIPFAEDLDGVEELYIQTFDDERWNSDGDVYVQHPDWVEVNSEMLFFPYDNGVQKKPCWSAIKFPIEVDFDEYVQYEISMDLQTNGEIAHRTIFGFFFNKPDKIPDKIGDGIWITPSCTGKVFFLGQSTVNKGGWGKSAGFASVNTEVGFADQLDRITFVVRQDKITGYLTKDGTMSKLFSLEILDDEIVIYDSTGTEVFRGANDGDLMRGTGFKVVSHDASTIIDNVLIRGY